MLDVTIFTILNFEHKKLAALSVNNFYKQNLSFRKKYEKYHRPLAPNNYCIFLKYTQASPLEVI
jgi:hypothetical protein